MAAVIEPIRADDRAAMDAWFDLATASACGSNWPTSTSWSAHPEVRAVDTWNADGNRWMIAINDAMGFVPISRVTDWELDLTRGQAGTTAAISAAASGP